MSRNLSLLNSALRQDIFSDHFTENFYTLLSVPEICVSTQTENALMEVVSWFRPPMPLPQDDGNDTVIDNHQ